jgi:hypothetical protein
MQIEIRVFNVSIKNLTRFVSQKVSIKIPVQTEGHKGMGMGRVADPGCLSRIPDPNFHPRFLIKGQKHSGSRTHFSIFNS